MTIHLLYTLHTIRQVCLWSAQLTQCKSNNLMYRNRAVCLQRQLSGLYKTHFWIFLTKQNKSLTWFKQFTQQNKWLYLRKSTATSYLGQDQICTKCTHCLLPVNICTKCTHCLLPVNICTKCTHCLLLVNICTNSTHCLLTVNIFSENKLKNKHILVGNCLWTETSIKMTCTRRYMQVDPLHQFQQQ